MLMLRAVTLGIGALVIAIVGTAGEFPLGDDWSYAGTVQRLVDEGRLRFGDWQSVLLIPQIVLGSIVTFFAGGFSFEALRISTLLFWLLGAFALISAFRDLELRPALAVIGLLTLALNPIVIWLSFSFMSDVPAVAFCALTVAGLVRHIRTRSKASFVVAILGAALATLTRQSGLALFVGIAAVDIWLGGWRRPRVARGVLLVVSGAALLWTVEQLLARTVGLPAMYYVRHEQLLSEIAHGGLIAVLKAAWWLYCAGVYLGVFLVAPVLCVPNMWRTMTIGRRAVMIIVIAMIAMPALVRQRPMPLLGNIINGEGLGVPLLGDMSVVQRLPWFVWWSVTAIGVVALAWLLMIFVRLIAQAIALRDSADQMSTALVVFATTVSILFLGLHAVIGFYDRYLAFLLPPLIVVVLLFAQRAGGPAKWQRVVAGAWIVVVSGWAVLASADSMAINRARWELLRALEEHGVRANDIDGGFEFNGWATGRPFKRSAGYMIAFGSDGYPVHDRRTVSTWLRGAINLYVVGRYVP